MKRLLIYIILLLTPLVFATCGQSYEQKQALSRKQHREAVRRDSAALKIATTPTMDCLPIFVAFEDSLFQRGGVEVHLRARTCQLDGDTLIEGGHVEGFVTDLMRAERLKKRGTPLRYVATTNSYWQFISNRRARVKELRQMSDKMVAITRFSATDYLADLAIDSVKTKFEVYRVQINDVNIRLKMLLNNEMDAALLTEPQATTARLFKNPVLMDSRDKDIHLGVIAFRENALVQKERKAQLDAFVKVYNNVCDSINKHGVAHYHHIIKKYMHVDDKTINALPKLHYQRAIAPREKDIARARQRWN
ncbi:MAG: ABC transporter substrate-binding protein [Prevotella sp.]|jgi:NitT/TauT family transport system substrate-binding protein